MKNQKSKKLSNQKIVKPKNEKQKTKKLQNQKPKN